MIVFKDHIPPTYNSGHIFPERLRVMIPPPSMPQQPFMAQPPPLHVLSQEISKRVRVQPGVPRPHAEHHAGPEDPPGQPQLPEVAAVVEDARAAHAGRTAAPVRVEVGRAEVDAVELDLGAALPPVPGPDVVAAVPERQLVRVHVRAGCRFRGLCGGIGPDRLVDAKRDISKRLRPIAVPSLRGGSNSY